jgi:hypothetical protein
MTYASVTSSPVARPQNGSDIKGEFSPFTKSCDPPLGISCMHFEAFLVSCQTMETAGFTTHFTFWCLQDTMKEYGWAYTAMLSACSRVTWLLD